jgi:phosphate transport system substrate-binding protein
MMKPNGKAFRLVLKVLPILAMIAALGCGKESKNTGTAATNDPGKGEAKITIDGSTTVGPIAKQFAEYYMKQHPGVKIEVNESGSGNGAKSLINSTCDIATMSRDMKPEEKNAAKDKGVNVMEHVIAMDGIAVIVHPANSVAALTKAQVADIYMGKITNWSQLGGPDAKIVVISRDTSSGTYEAFGELVLKKQKMAEGVEYVTSSGAIRQRVMSTQGAVGYVGIGFVDKSIKALVIDGIEPSAETVLSKTYPITRPLFMYTNGAPKEGTHLQAFVKMYLTQKGREIIGECGFVPLAQK